MKKGFLYLLLICFFNTKLHAAIPQNATTNFSAQIKIAKDNQLPMSQRWQALIQAAEVAKFQEIEQIKEFVKSKDWYMRNASLIALQKININHALDEAKILITDKALVVRSAAVDTLASKFTIENRDILVQELNKPYNFKKNQSLWIRPKIFSILASRAQNDDRSFYARYLFDSDVKIAQQSMDVLEKMTDTHFEGVDKLKNWQSYVKKNSWF